MSQCPFYGMHAIPAMRRMVSSNGDQCGLRDGYAPCQMEIDRKRPELEACNFNGTGRAVEYAKFERVLFRQPRSSADYPD